MALNKSLISKFVKTTSTNTKNIKKETFLHGYIVIDNGKTCVKVSDYAKDGKSSDSYIPVKITTNVNVDQPVTVMIKNHTATVIGNAADVDKEEEVTVLNDTANVTSISSTKIQSLWADYFNEN